MKLQVASGLSSLYSPTHPVKIETLGPDGALVTWEADNVLPTEDFSLFFAPSEGGFGGGLLTGSRANQEHFLFLFAPEAGPTQDQVMPKDIVFVIDRSGSMSDEKIQQAQDALHFILRQLDEQDRLPMREGSSR